MSLRSINIIPSDIPSPDNGKGQYVYKTYITAPPRILGSEEPIKLPSFSSTLAINAPIRIGDKIYDKANLQGGPITEYRGLCGICASETTCTAWFDGYCSKCHFGSRWVKE